MIDFAKMTMQDHERMADAALKRHPSSRETYWPKEPTRQTTKPKEEEVNVLLEAGDSIGWSDEGAKDGAGHRCCVVAVSGDKARLVALDDLGWRRLIPRRQSEGMLVPLRRFSEHERRNNLNNLLAVAGVAAVELTKPIDAEEGLTEDMKRNKGKSSAAPKAAKKDKVDIAKTPSKATLIDGMLDGTHTKREIARAVVEAYGRGGDTDEVAFNRALKQVNDRPFHMKKAGKVGKWKEEPKAEGK